jgi:hypothetical protein
MQLGHGADVRGSGVPRGTRTAPQKSQLPGPPWREGPPQAGQWKAGACTPRSVRFSDNVAAMIAYEVLVQTIADWKAGARPSAPNVPPPPPRSTGAPQVVEEVESGVVDLDEGQELEGEYATDSYDDEG